MERSVLAVLVNTLRREFGHVALFYGGGQGILVASMSPLRASEARVLALQARPEVAATTPGGRPLLDLLGDVLVAGSDLDAFLEDSAREAGVSLSDLISTDGNLYLEYKTPRGNVLPWSAREDLVRAVREFRTDISASSLKAP
jgi:spermidine synthase